MTFIEFRQSAMQNEPPEVNIYLTALWYDMKGEWSRAHEISQEIHNSMGSWIHAYLHRKEGDSANAEYWYRRAGKKITEDSLDQEFINMAEYFLKMENKTDDAS